MFGKERDRESKRNVSKVNKKKKRNERKEKKTPVSLSLSSFKRYHVFEPHVLLLAPPLAVKSPGAKLTVQLHEPELGLFLRDPPERRVRVPARSAVEVEPPTLRPHGPFADDVPGLGLRVEREQLIVRVGLDGGAPGLGDGPPRQRLETRGQRGELGGVVGGFRKGGGVGCGGGCSCLGLGRGVGEGLPEAGAGRCWLFLLGWEERERREKRERKEIGSVRGNGQRKGRKEGAKGRGAAVVLLICLPFSFSSSLPSQRLPRRARDLVQEGSGADGGREGVEVRPDRLQGRHGRGRGRREGRRRRKRRHFLEVFFFFFL